MPPLGLLNLAAVLREKVPNITIDIADYEIKSEDSDPIFSNYDIIGLTGTTVHIPHAVKLIKRIRVENIDACIVMGGAHATFCHEELLKTIPELDAVFRGEGENSIVDFVNNYKGRKHLPIIVGVSTRDNISDKLAYAVSDLDTLPDPAYDLINLGKYQLSTHRKALPLPFASIMTSRGCPFQCSYCQTPNMFGNKIRYRSPDRIALEIKKLIDTQKIKSVVFWDDTFTSSKEHINALCDKIMDFDIRWMCNTRVECVSLDMLVRMKKAGCQVIFYGVESSHQDTLFLLNRTTKKIDIINAFSWTRQIGIQSVATLMIGAPSDDFKRIEENVTFIKSLEPDHAYISIYNAVPGSKEFQRAKIMGLIDEDIDWTNPKYFLDSPYGLPTVNEQLNRFQLQMAQKYAYRQFYGKEGDTQYE